MTKLKFFVQAPLVLVTLLTAWTTPAQAEIYSGTHPKLGNVNLSINTYIDTSKRGKPTYHSGITWQIRKGKIRAYGVASSTDDLYGSRGIYQGKDVDNTGYSCHAKVTVEAPVRETVSVSFDYEDGFNCPVSGKSYNVILNLAPPNAFFAVAPDVDTKIWLTSDRGGKNKSHFVYPGDVLYQQGNTHRMRMNLGNGWGSAYTFLKNGRTPGWGV